MTTECNCPNGRAEHQKDCPMTTELVELADCPFCGHEAKLNERDFGLVAVLCNARDGGCGAMGGWDEHESEAAKLWNTRALASRAGGWTSVTDRLPIDLETFDGVFMDRNVLATDGHSVEQASFQAGNGAGKPWVAWSNYNPFKSTQITHWQPLPEPPAAPEPVGVG